MMSMRTRKSKKQYTKLNGSYSNIEMLLAPKIDKLVPINSISDQMESLESMPTLSR